MHPVRGSFHLPQLCVALRLLPLLVPLLTAACSSSSAYVNARRHPGCTFTAASRIAIAPHREPRIEEQVLQQALQLELQSQGFQLVDAADADFTLACWIEEAWKPGKQVVYVRRAGMRGIQLAQPLLLPGGDFGSMNPTFTPRIVNAPYNVQGIRLKLLPARAGGSERFRPAWEGYIEGGATVRARREAVLLRTLFQYFGRDFDGQSPLAK